MTDLLLALLALALFGGAAHAQQPSAPPPGPPQVQNWRSWDQGFTRHYEGTNPRGGTWTGQSHKEGFTTYFDAYGPDGQTQHCRSYPVGFTTVTECDRGP